MNYRVSYYDSRNDEYVALEFEFYGQTMNAFNGLSHLDYVKNLTWEKI